MPLTNEQILHYSRHLIMPEVGVEGQEKLLAAKVLLIGGGGLGAPLSLYLAAAGVGTLGLVDFDVVDLTNLQRQVIYTTADVGRPKVEAATERVQALNPDVRFIPFNERLSRQNIQQIIKDFDIVVDGTDNFPTRYLVNDACVFAKKPNVYGSIFRFEGQTTVFYPFQGPCYRCLYPEPPPPGEVPSCAEGGVLGILPGLIGLIQATETIKLILGKGEPLVGRLLLFNALDMKFREVKLQRDTDCPVCGDHPTVKELIDYEQFCGVGRGMGGGGGQEEAAVQPAQGISEILPKELEALRRNGRKVFLLDVREPEEYNICHLEGSHLIPLGTLPQRVNELDSADEIVTYCKMGGRSAKAADFLRKVGFRKVRNLKGGITAWAREVDPSMPTY
ncbi:MAG: molybdopterin-synthase adenylyltransferase MoeB [Elusimicrobia bacterium]|nr:molybdopterin-synthase adenylyltransferase MoeB [Elusimicrobiota bacterium]